MTTNDSQLNQPAVNDPRLDETQPRPVQDRAPEKDFDELIVEEEDYTPPPPRDDAQDAVPIEVIAPDDQAQDEVQDPTPPDVAPQAAPGDHDREDRDDRPDMPRTLDGEPSDFAPLRVPTVDGAEATDLTADSADVTGQTVPQRVPDSDGPPVAGGADDDARWQEIQVRFVDDPAAAVGQAADLVEGAVARLREAYDSQPGSEGSTEQLRLAFRRYRAIHELTTRADVP